MMSAFVQGDPCVRGHSGLRYATGRRCVECARADARAAKKTDAGRARNRMNHLKIKATLARLRAEAGRI